MTVTPGSNGAFSATANLTPAYCGNAAVRSWQRKLDFAQRKLTVSDTFSLGTGTTAPFQVNVPVQPTVNGREASAGRLHLRVLQPRPEERRVGEEGVGKFRSRWSPE